MKYEITLPLLIAGTLENLEHFILTCALHPLVSKKVKFTLEQATKAQSGWVVNATPRPLNPRERHGTHSIRDWVGPRADPDGCRKSCPHRDSILGP